MNVFSEAAIQDLNDFATWVTLSSVAGVVVRSGKTSAFCVGADLGELGQAYDMIMSAMPDDRYNVAFNHFFKLSIAIRALETCGKPVASVVSGLALGGGCELAMGTHYRVLTASPKAELGLPESLVGLLPGGGGTQRLPRLIGVQKALPILLKGARLSGKAALDSGLVDALVVPGGEVEAAECWVLANPDATAAWDKPGWIAADRLELSKYLELARIEVLMETLGHYPAPLTILDCIEQGYMEPIDQALKTEMMLFSRLIQRPEPRDMIRTMFVGKTEYDRRMRAGGLPDRVQRAIEVLPQVWRGIPDQAQSTLAKAGFSIDGIRSENFHHDGGTYWFDQPPIDLEKSTVRALLDDLAKVAINFANELDPECQRLADYAAVTKYGFPSYLGGPFSLLKYRNNLHGS